MFGGVEGLLQLNTLAGPQGLPPLFLGGAAAGGPQHRDGSQDHSLWGSRQEEAAGSPGTRKLTVAKGRLNTDTVKELSDPASKAMPSESFR